MTTIRHQTRLACTRPVPDAVGLHKMVATFKVKCTVLGLSLSTTLKRARCRRPTGKGIGRQTLWPQFSRRRNSYQLPVHQLTIKWSTVLLIRCSHQVVMRNTGILHRTSKRLS